MNRQCKITEVQVGYRGRAFTSDLSARGLWLMFDKNFEPLGMVAGSCAYSVGTLHPWAVEIKGSFHGEFRKRYGVARVVALARMQFEADQLGADGIIGVQSKFERLHNSTWTEVTVLGTAVRYMGRNPYTPPRQRKGRMSTLPVHVPGGGNPDGLFRQREQEETNVSSSPSSLQPARR